MAEQLSADVQKIIDELKKVKEEKALSVKNLQSEASAHICLLYTSDAADE